MAVLRKQKQIIKGSHLMIFIQNTLGEYEPIAFAQSHTLSKVLNVKDIMSKDFGDASAVMPQNYSWSMQTDNLYSLQGYKQLNDAFKQMKRVRIYFGESTYKQDTPQNSIVDKDGASDWKTDGFGEEGDAYITSLDVTASAGDNATFSATFTGTGPLRQIEGYESKYLTFEALEDTTFTFTQNALQYSLDNGNTWTTLPAGTTTPTVTAGNKIMWKQTGLTPNVSSQPYGIGTFSATGNFKAYGNIMSLYYGDNFIGQVDLTGKIYAFYKLFINNSKIIDASNLILPATILDNACYERMFDNCTSLTTAPKLPATTLDNFCYDSMFWGCTSLIIAPELPATTLVQGCYSGMFWGCTSLTKAPELPAATLHGWCYSELFNGCPNINYIKCLATDISAQGCTNYWVNGVSATGTFVKAASMSDWTTGQQGIPEGWTVIDA